MTVGADMSLEIAPTRLQLRQRTCAPSSGTRRRSWALAVSVAAHMVVAAVFLLAPDAAPPSPQAIPQIELLAATPLPPQPAEAMPSPAVAPVKEYASVAAPAAPPRQRQVLKPLLSTSERAEATAAKVVPENPPRPNLPPATTPVETTETRKSPSSDAAALPVSGASSERHTQQGAPSATDRPAGPPPDYMGLISALLEKAKRYPPEARAEGQEGIVGLAFTLDRSGQLLGWKIKRGSGHAALDEEAGRMVQRAAPFPPFPPTLERERMTVVVPVEFSLKNR